LKAGDDRNEQKGTVKMASIETPVSRRLATVKNIIIVISGKGEFDWRALRVNCGDRHA
jgi:hypothetical protein